MNAWWSNADADAMVCKNSQRALITLITLYEQLECADRPLADQVIGEWITSRNSRKRFDALALVDHFHIRSTIPQLRALDAKLARNNDCKSLYERTKIKRILESLDPEEEANA